MKITELYGHRQPSPEGGTMLADANYKKGTISCARPDLIVGLELEIESFPYTESALAGIRFVEDGSLRNMGREGVTLPMYTMYVEQFLRDFYTRYKVTPKNFSDRCSTHVHVNVLDLTLDQLKTVALVYQTVERLLFTFIGQERENNIFCVPWYQAGITSNMMQQFTNAGGTDKVIRQWVKYTSLNLLPVRVQGTIEFRHLRGTCDVEEIMTWLNLIGCIMNHATQNSYENVSKTILDMNTVSNYDVFLESIFKEHTPVLRRDANYQQLLSVGVIDSKLMLTTVVKPKKEEAPEEEVTAAALDAFNDQQLAQLRATDERAQRAEARQAQAIWRATEEEVQAAIRAAAERNPPPLRATIVNPRAADAVTNTIAGTALRRPR